MWTIEASMGVKSLQGMYSDILYLFSNVLLLTRVLFDFQRYLRIIQELHRVELEDVQREEKLAFFINLYNMMAIHSILVWGHPAGTFDRTKMFMDFKYVIGGYTYSLSAIQNGILRGNQRPMFNPMKPFGVKDKRSKVKKLLSVSLLSQVS